MYRCIAVTNCTGQRSFSVLKRVKNDMTSTVTNERLNALVLLDIEADSLRSLNMDSFTNDFGMEKDRNKNCFQNLY